MKNELNVVGIQADLVWENPKENLAFFEKEIKALSTKTDIVILPEMFSTGFTMNPEKVAETMNGNTVCWMLKMATEFDIAILGSVVISDANDYYNRMIFVHPSKKIETYDKRHSFTLAGEDKAYTSGHKRLIVTYKGWRICPLICYDLRFPVWARNTKDYDLLIYVANWPVARIKAWSTLLTARAIENISYVIGVNRTGTDVNNLEYSGNSLIIDYLGEQLTEIEAHKTGTLKATLLKNKLESTRKKLNFLNDMDSFKITY